jgi:hypothetical protein
MIFKCFMEPLTLTGVKVNRRADNGLACENNSQESVSGIEYAASG